ncbi:MAG: LysM peptidoglycan-binding domain-containing protein, partial [Clostridia bacterium]|nr:LysM peptidoglycan-binding domain-containing protein [Clostridia bacterium]
MATKKHLVRDGDTLETLARQYGVSAQSIALEN